MKDTLEKLQGVIQSRQKADPEKSYVAKLFNEGEEKICRKVTEEATEVLIASLKEGDEELTSESADLLFHLMVLLTYKNISPSKVFDELEKRMGISGLDEKALRIAQNKGK